MTTAVNLVRGFRHLRALVIGDAMLDTYLEGTAARLCSEGPVPVVRKTSELRAPGGAANTAANLRALDADVIFLGIMGRDIAASLLRSSLRERGVDDSFLVEDEYASTLHKLRILADGQYVVRFDDEETHQYSQASQQKLLDHLEEVFPRCDLVVVSDYCYGVVSDELIDKLRRLLTAYPKVLLVDSKDLYRFRDEGATVITPNDLEARLLVEPTSPRRMPRRADIKSPTPPSSSRAPTEFLRNTHLAEIERIGEQLLAMINAKHAAITMAGDGVFLMNRDGTTKHLPAHPVQQAYDIGAGDSFAAALALALGAGASIEEATKIGIDAAGIAVTKRSTSVVYYQELLQRVSLRDHASGYTRLQADSSLTSPESMEEALSRLVEQLNIERQAGRTIVFTNGVFDILHAGHVHFLRQAKELGDVLVVGLNTDRSAQRLKGKSRPINSVRDRLALVAALDPVDHVILFDEDTPTELIRALRPQIHVKGGDYADEVLPEAEAVREVGGRVVILPLAGSMSTSSVIDRIISLASGDGKRKIKRQMETTLTRLPLRGHPSERNE